VADEVYAFTAEVTAPVYDTEVSDRVGRAITELFPVADPEYRHGELRGEVHDLERFSELLHRREILDTARGVFFENRQGEQFSFRVKKQPAFVGVVTFVADEPGELGAITVRVEVEAPSVDAVIDHVAPPTEDGRPVEP